MRGAVQLAHAARYEINCRNVQKAGLATRQFLRSSHLNTESNVNVLSSLFAKKPSKRCTALRRRTRMKVLLGKMRLM